MSLVQVQEGVGVKRHPPYPVNHRQGEYIALGQRMGAIAAEQADAHDRANTFPHDTFQALREAGYLAITVPVEFGGPGATPLEVMLAQEQLASGSGAVALAATMHLGAMGGLADSRSWPTGLLERIFHEVLTDGALINGLASEPELGSPSRGGGFRTTARAVDGGYLVNGRKTWSTLSPALTYGNVLLTVVERDGTENRGALLVPMSSTGVRIEETWDNLAMRATGSHDVVFEDVFVPEDLRLPQAKGLPAGHVSGWNLLGSAVYLGIAQAARDFAVQFAKDRVPAGLGKPISELQTVQHRVAQMELLLLQARSVLYGTAELWDKHPDQRADLGWRFAAAKYTVTNHAIDITDQALRVVGSVGLQRRYPLERYFRDVRAGLGNPPMDDVALTLIGKQALNIEA
ncbi:MAG TPA: acyl-CoA dehydrogenase family protein [Thermomicrobiales bacterium]|nr:acyl-CoA dehydrogenase family protein [Thermomicrobiales bacterium]